MPGVVPRLTGTPGDDQARGAADVGAHNEEIYSAGSDSSAPNTTACRRKVSSEERAMLIRTPGPNEPRSSEITPRAVYLNRRAFMSGAAVVAAATVAAAKRRRRLPSSRR